MAFHRHIAPGVRLTHWHPQATQRTLYVDGVEVATYSTGYGGPIAPRARAVAAQIRFDTAERTRAAHIAKIENIHALVNARRANS